MKNLKEHKVQILAALALAFSLGLAMPGAVFAAEGGADENDGIMLLAAQDDEEITSDKLYTAYNQIKTGEADYSKYLALYNAQTALAENLNDATPAQINAVVSAVAQIVDGAGIGDMDAAELNNYVLNNVPSYGTWKTVLAQMASIEEKAGTPVSAANIKAKMTTNEIVAAYNVLNGFNNRVTGTRADNIVKLYNRITTNNSGYNFAGYRAALPLVSNVAVLSNPGDATEAAVAAAKSGLISAIQSLLPSEAASVNAEMENSELIAVAKKLPQYNEYAALYNATAFLRDLGTTTVTATAIANKYTPSQQMNYYNAMAAAAEKIDNSVMTGLMTYKAPEEMPNTSAGGDEGKDKPNTPNAGIVGLFESGALDLGTITLIVSVAVASIAGLGLIAKLYLKHKF